jgi:hypothetical protein
MTAINSMVLILPERVVCEIKDRINAGHCFGLRAFKAGLLLPLKYLYCNFV